MNAQELQQYIITNIKDDFLAWCSQWVSYEPDPIVEIEGFEHLGTNTNNENEWDDYEETTIAFKHEGKMFQIFMSYNSWATENEFVELDPACISTIRTLSNFDSEEWNR